MSEITVILKNGTEHVLPEENLSNIQRVLGDKIKKIVRAKNEEGEAIKASVNRSAMETVVKREHGVTDKKLKAYTDDELLQFIQTGKDPKKSNQKPEREPEL